jgi:hypothetical protein
VGSFMLGRPLHDYLYILECNFGVIAPGRDIHDLPVIAKRRATFPQKAINALYLASDQASDYGDIHWRAAALATA